MKIAPKLCMALCVAALGACARQAELALPQEIAEKPKPSLEVPVQEEELAPRQTPAEPRSIPSARLIWDESIGARTLIIDTPEGEVSISNIGHGSAMLKFDATVVHVNPWYGVGDYSTLPKADQVWITDANPEHMDIRAIRSISTPSTALIVDSGSAKQLAGLLDFQAVETGGSMQLPPLELDVISYSTAEVNSKGLVEKHSNTYLAKFGDFRLLVGGGLSGGLYRGLLGAVDVAMLPAGGASFLDPRRLAETAKKIQPGVVLPYQVGEHDPAQIAELLAGSGIQVWTINPVQDEELGHHRASPAEPSALPIEAPDLDHLSPADLTRIIETHSRASSILLPDLNQIPAFDLHLQLINRGDPVKRLRLSSSVQNLGDGPLELEGTTDPEAEVTVVTQRIHTQAGLVRNHPVGKFVLHPEHHHWHLEGFTVYEVWSLNPTGTLDQVVASSGKVSFCIRDFGRSPQITEFRYAQYTRCGVKLQGISAGWYDTYKYYLAGQSIDVTALEDGVYALVSSADPFNFIQELDESNNVAVVYFNLDGNRIDVLEHPPREPQPLH